MTKRAVVPDSGAQLLTAGMDVHDGLLAIGEIWHPLEDYSVSGFTADMTTKAIGFFITDVTLACPAQTLGGTAGSVTLWNQQVIIIPGSEDEILLSDWCLKAIGVDVHALLRTIMADHPTFDDLMTMQ